MSILVDISDENYMIIQSNEKFVKSTLEVKIIVLLIEMSIIGSIILINGILVFYMGYNNYLIIRLI